LTNLLVTLVELAIVQTASYHPAMKLSGPTKTQLPGYDRILLALFALGAVLWTCLTLRQGYDLDWDVLNYHFYNGFALVHGKVFTNLAVSMQQSYFPPLMDAAFYLLVRLLPATGVALVIAMFQSLAFPLLFQIARLLLAEMFGSGLRLNIIAFAVALLGAVAPVNIREAGGALGDTSSAVLVLAALLLMVDTMTRQSATISLRRMAVAGTLAGCAAGLKLTNMSFALGLVGGLAAALLLLRDRIDRRSWLLATTAALAGMAAGFLLTYGWWGLLLYRHLGNPVFPNFNQFFRSPYAAPASYADPSFQLPTLRDKILFPFARAPIIGQLNPAGLFDLRMALGLPLCLLGLLATCFRRPGIAHRAHVRAADAVILVFVPVSYVGWLLVFPINRYLVAADMVAPLACVIGAITLWRARTVAWTMTIVLAVALPASAYVSRDIWWLPGWHRHGDGSGYFDVRFAPPRGLDGGVVAMTNDLPISFVIPFFPHDTTFVRLQGSLLYFYPDFNSLGPSSSAVARHAVFGTALGEAVCRTLDENKGALFLLRPGPDTAHDVAAMTYFGVAQAQSNCIDIITKANLQLQLCPALRLPAPECQS
jgi:hypothetical protein